MWALSFSLMPIQYCGIISIGNIRVSIWFWISARTQNISTDTEISYNQKKSKLHYLLVRTNFARDTERKIELDNELVKMITTHFYLLKVEKETFFCGLKKRIRDIHCLIERLFLIPDLYTCFWLSSIRGFYPQT